MLSQNNFPEPLGKVLSGHSRLSGRYQLPIELLHILSPPSTLALALTRTVKYCVQNGLLSVQH